MTLTWPLVRRLLRKNGLWLLLFPPALAGAVAYFTRGLPREYIATASIYTGIASGYSITSTDNERMDFTAVTNGFDNLIATVKARETLREVGLHLLARHLSLKAPHPAQLGLKAFQAVQEMRDPALRKAAVKGDEAATYANLLALATARERNAVTYLLEASNTPYAVDQLLANLTVARRNSSDMLDLSFKGTDPAICQQTLDYLIATFKRRYTEFRSSETGNVVAYFEEEVKKSLSNLKGAEDKMTKYGLDNKIINYAEQSKYVAAAKEGAIGDYVKEQMALDAARSAREAMEKKLDEQGSVLLANQDLTARRTDLAKAQTQLANAVVYGHPAETVKKLQADVARLSDELKVAVQRYYTSTTSLGTMPQRELMSAYIDNAIRYQESAARMGVMEKRIADFDQIYTELAPLGSSVSRIGREISVAEREYLSILHGLNLARLRQKDLQMSGTLTTLDPPLLPNKPQPSSQKLLVVASYLAGLMLVLSIAVGRTLLSRRVTSPERAGQFTELPLAGALPAVRKRFARYDLDRAEQELLHQLRSTVLLETPEPQEPHRPCRLVTLLSTQPEQGKTWVGQRLSEQFARAGHRVLYLHPVSDEAPTAPEGTEAYPVEWDFADRPQIGGLFQHLPGRSTDDFDFIFLELPVLLDAPLPVHLVGQSDLSLLVVHASSVWKSADALLLSRYRKAARRPVMAVLNAVEPDFLGGLLGRMPKRKKGKTTAPAAPPKPTPVAEPA